MSPGPAGRHPVDVAVGRMIRLRRRMRGMTQPDLARAIGVAFQQVQKYETGLDRVSASRLWEIACALEVPVADLFSGVERGTAASALDWQAIAEDPEALALVRHYRAIPEKNRARLLQLVRAIQEGEESPR